MDPAGRHALVTGGGSGIGAAIVAALRDAGAIVTVLGRRPASDPFYQQADVTDAVSVRAAIANAETAHGRCPHGQPGVGAPHRLDPEHDVLTAS